VRECGEPVRGGLGHQRGRQIVQQAHCTIMLPWFSIANSISVSLSRAGALDQERPAISLPAGEA